ncbi:MAG: alpha/beta hydrolase fold containing protein [Gemmatimonadetes bacterium]|nr:alpha/beta hydrolase fold containing protein [Gemmatimonadota bacterium]
MLTTAVAIVAVVVPLLVAVVGLAWWQQERIVWQPAGSPFPQDPAEARRVTFTARDGQPLFGYVVGEAGVGAPVLVFHGNADLAAAIVPWARVVARRTGRRVFVPEYRGYGGLAGAPTYVGSALDADAALAFARESLGAGPQPVALYGHSLGTAIAAELASREGAEVLILESPFTSARGMAAAMFGPPLVAFWRWIARVHFDTAEKVRTLDAPVWVAHGDRDRVIPVRMGREVFAAARRPGELLIVSGGGHDDLPETGGEAYWSWLERALRAR